MTKSSVAARGVVALIPALAAASGSAACRDPVAAAHIPPPIVASAVVTGRVTGPTGGPVPAQLVYVYSDFTLSCDGASLTLLGLARTDGTGVYRFDRVVAPVERADVCVAVAVRPEARTGLADSYLIGYVDFRLLPPVDTARVDFELTIP